MNVSVNTPYGELVLTSWFRSSDYNPHDHCCFGGEFNLDGSPYVVALNMMRPPGLRTWQIIDIARNKALPRPWSISLYPFGEVTQVNAIPLDLNEQDIIDINCPQLVASVFACVFHEITLIQQASSWREWVILDANLEHDLRKYRIALQSSAKTTTLPARGSG